MIRELFFVEHESHEWHELDKKAQAIKSLPLGRKKVSDVPNVKKMMSVDKI